MFDNNTTVGIPGSHGEAWFNVFVKLIDCNYRVWATGPYISGKIAW